MIVASSLKQYKVDVPIIALDYTYPIDVKKLGYKVNMNRQPEYSLGSPGTEGSGYFVMDGKEELNIKSGLRFHSCLRNRYYVVGRGNDICVIARPVVFIIKWP